MLTETIVQNLSHRADGKNTRAAVPVIDVPDVFPWRITDQWVPNSNSGYVYLLVSTPHPEQVYVGTTENLAVRITQHNRGYGAQETAIPEFLPWAIGSYISGMSHLSRSERMSIEKEWQILNRRSVNEGMGCLEQFIENGRSIMTEHNSMNEQYPERKLSYVILGERRYCLEYAEDSNSS